MHLATYVISSKAKAAGSRTVVQANIHSRSVATQKLETPVLLLQSILVPDVHYGCELWGMHSP